MRKLCVYGEYVGEVLAGENIKGGAELQSALIAKAAASQGVPAVIVDPIERVRQQAMANLVVEPVDGWNNGLRGLRLFTHRVPGLIRSLQATEADVYYARGFSFHFLLPLYVARRNKAVFLLGVASDTDLMSFADRYKKSYRGRATLWDWVSTIIPNELASYVLLAFSDAVLVQHGHQVSLARTKGKRVVQMNNILDSDLMDIAPRQRRKNVIVVGALSLPKGLRTLLPVIDELSDTIFEFVGEAIDKEGRSVKEQLQGKPNVILHGPLNRRKTCEKIAAAKVLLNTSPREGFPNTFLEAWALRTPVISLHVDPGGVIEEHKLGYVCHGNLNLFRELIKRDCYDVDVERAREYVIEHHSFKHALHVLQSLNVNSNK